MRLDLFGARRNHNITIPLQEGLIAALYVVYLDQHSGAMSPSAGWNLSKMTKNAVISLKLNQFYWNLIKIIGKKKKNVFILQNDSSVPKTINHHLGKGSQTLKPVFFLYNMSKLINIDKQ